MSDSRCSNADQRQALGLVTHDNTGGPFVVECQGCGAVYPSFQCSGGSQIADTGDYNDTCCPHCEIVDPEECENVGLAWNTQQLKINEMQQRLAVADERIDELTIPDGYCLMPVSLTAENGAKALLLGEFKLRVTEECPECRELDEPTEGCEICDGEGEYGQQYTISWDQIKFIYSKAVEGLAVKAETDKL